MTWPADVDPGSLKQPDGVSCGATAVVAARMLHDPEYRPDDPGDTIRQLHGDLVALRSGGRLQLPWPRSLGTPPWALARELGLLTGSRPRTHLARLRPAASYDVLAARAAERPTGVYLGNRWLPRHVVLAVGSEAGSVTVFDPARGELVRVARRRWAEHEVGVAGWSHSWFVV